MSADGYQVMGSGHEVDYLAGCLGQIIPHDKLCCMCGFHKSGVDHRRHHMRKGLLYSREGAGWCGPPDMLWAQGPDREGTL